MKVRVLNAVYDLIDKDNDGEHDSNQDDFGTLMSDLDSLLQYVEDDNNISSHAVAREEGHGRQIVYDARKAVWKLWDHVNLAQRQYKTLRQSEPEYDARFQKRIGKIQAEMSGQMNAQLLS